MISEQVSAAEGSNFLLLLQAIKSSVLNLFTLYFVFDREKIGIG